MACVVAVVLAAQAAPVRAAEASPAKRLARKYSPIVVLRAQQQGPCDDTEEQYEPTVVDIMLDNPEVNLVIPDPNGGATRTLKEPGAADIAGLGSDAYLNIPGNPLNPGCKFARDFATLKKSGRAPPVTYARVVRQPGEGELALQYWFFYWFNQFNDVHEGDWEGMQIMFPAATAERALRAEPTEVGLFQHAGGEWADWEDRKLERRGNHPVVYAAAGSHASFYDSTIYLENGQEGSGLGCDNTTEPVREVRPKPVLMPTNPTRDGAFAWLTYEGLWGQHEEGFNNGPAGPNTKLQWFQPRAKMDQMRATSAQLPGGALVGPAVTSAFCGAVATVSQALIIVAETPGGAIGLALLGLLAVAVPVGLTRWRPADPIPLRRPRAFGQLLRAARKLYGRHPATLLALGFSSLVVVGIFAGAAWLIRQVVGDSDAFQLAGESGVQQPLSGSILALGSTFASAVASIAVITFVRELEQSRALGPLATYRALRPRFWRALWTGLLEQLVLILLMLSVIGIPYAIKKFVDWHFVEQEVLFEDRRVRESFRGSSRVVRGNWWRALRTILFLWVLGALAGPVLGFALIFTQLSPWVINVFGSLVFAVLLPYLVLGRTLLYLDLTARRGATGPGDMGPVLSGTNGR